MIVADVVGAHARKPDIHWLLQRIEGMKILKSKTKLKYSPVKVDLPHLGY